MATKHRSSGRRYGKKASKKVERAMHEYKHGKLKAGAGHHPKAKSRKQAIAIGLSEARAEGDKVPPRKGSKSRKRASSSRRSSARKGSSSKKRSSSSRSRSSSSRKKSSSSRKRSSSKKRRS